MPEDDGRVVPSDKQLHGMYKSNVWGMRAR